MKTVTINSEYNQKNLTLYLQQNGLAPAGVGTLRNEADHFLSMYVEIPEEQEAQLTTLLASYNDTTVYNVDLKAIRDLATQAAGEIDYLQTTIPTIDAMTAGQVRSVVKRLAQENLAIIKGLRYLVKNL